MRSALLSELIVVKFAPLPPIEWKRRLVICMTAGVPAHLKTWTLSTAINTFAFRHCHMKCSMNPGLEHFSVWICVVERFKPESFNMFKIQTKKMINNNKSLESKESIQSLIRRTYCFLCHTYFHLIPFCRLPKIINFILSNGSKLWWSSRTKKFM